MRTVQEIFQAHSESKIATAKHLFTLARLASTCGVIWEIGVNWGASSSAFLHGLPPAGKLISVDLKITPKAKELKQAAGDKWELIQGNSLQVEFPGPSPDLIFFDGLHCYNQLLEELRRFGDKSLEWLAFHDTITFGVWGADGETGQYAVQPKDRSCFDPNSHGIRLAIDDFQTHKKHWRLHSHNPHGHGLLVLRREL